MNTEDLMIGDWVRNIADGKPIKVYEILCSGINPTYYQMSDEIEDYIHCDEIEPIPLTPELLEKIGFEEVKGMWHQKDRLFRISSYEYVRFYKHSAVHTEDEVGLVDSVGDCGDYGYEDNYLCDVQYVHKLQHAIKLFEMKLEKEIEL